MKLTPQARSRVDWALPYARQVRVLRACILAVGLTVSVVFAEFHPRHLLEAPFLVNVALFLVATGLTWTPGYLRFQPSIMTPVALLDVTVICLFDLIPESEVVDALIVLPAMWLGLTLGRRGVATAVGVVAVLAITPGLLAQGVPEEGWAQAVSFIVLAGLAAAGMTLSVDIWANQLRRMESQAHALESACRVKGDFIAMVSHELRTPLTSIVGYVDILDDMEEPLSDEALRYLAGVSRNSERMLLLVTDLLEASDVENRPMRLTRDPTDVSALAHLSLDDFAQRASQAGLTLVRNLPPDVVITADASRLLQVMDNLVSNAIKFTPAGGCISVDLVRQDDGIDLVVSDTGVGIAAESVPHLGTKFFRTPQTVRAAIPGIGLGLMITKTIVEAHRGTLTVTSREDEGTSVCVHLPIDVSRTELPLMLSRDLTPAEAALTSG
jgi:signal transduction histidine kinase